MVITNTNTANTGNKKIKEAHTPDRAVLTKDGSKEERLTHQANYPTDNKTPMGKRAVKSPAKVNTKSKANNKHQATDEFDKNYLKHQNNEQFIWNEGGTKLKATDFWNKLPDKTRKAANPYATDHLWKEGDSLHDECRIAHVKIPLQKDELHTIDQWVGLFKSSFQANFIAAQDKHAKRLRTLAVRMAVTEPRAIFDGASWKGLKLLSRDMTQAWVAARTLFGDIWYKKAKDFDLAAETQGMNLDKDSDEEMTNEQPSPKETNRNEKEKTEKEKDKETNKPTGKPAAISPEAKKVGFDPTSGKAVNQFFLVKTLRKKKDRTVLDHATYTRKNKAYTTVRLPKVTKEDDVEAEKEVVEFFNAMAKRFFHNDRKAVIHTWNDSKTVKPLVDSSTLPKVRSQMEQYVDRVFIEYNKSAYCRLRIGFDIDEVQFFEDDWFKSRGYWVGKDKLQIRIICNVGWLMGSAAIQEANGKDLAEALRQLPGVKDKLPLDIRMHGIKLEQQEKINRKDLVRCANVYGDYNKAAATRLIVRKIYKDGKRNGFPLGQKMRFIPNIADARYPVTAGTRANIRVLRGKQKTFLKNIRTHKSNTIQGLDYYIPEIEVTLRQVIMAIRTGEDVEKALFISVEDAGGTSAVFTFHKNNSDEARQLVTSLPIMLERQYGARIWTWFTEDAKAETAGWYYDEAEQRLVSPDEKYTADILEDSDWDDDSIEEQDEDVTPHRFSFNNKIILDQPAKSNHYGDNGSVKTYDNPFKKTTEDDASMPGTVTTQGSTTTPSSVSGGTQDMAAMTDAVLKAMQQGDINVKNKLQQALQSASQSVSNDKGNGVDD
jgi:hypothetical protein